MGKSFHNHFHSKSVNPILARLSLEMFKLQIDILQLKFSLLRSVVVPLKQCDLTKVIWFNQLKSSHSVVYILRSFSARRTLNIMHLFVAATFLKVIIIKVDSYSSNEKSYENFPRSLQNMTYPCVPQFNCFTG